MFRLKNVRSISLAILVSLGVAATPVSTYAYTYVGTMPSEEEITISADPTDAWKEDKTFTNASTAFTVNSPQSDGKYTTGQAITLSVTPRAFYNTRLPGGFSTGADNNLIMTIVKGDTVQKEFRVDYSENDTGQTFTDSFTPTEEGTYIVNIFYRGSTTKGSNLGNYLIEVAKAEASPTPTSEPTPTPEKKATQEPITISKAPASVRAEAKKNKVTVSWKKIKKTKKTNAVLSQIKSIEVQYSTDSKFKKNTGTKTVGKNKTKVTLKLQKKTTYYVRVRYRGKDGVSKWSKVKKVKVK